jgi:dienelactone hydrolase
VKRQSTLRLFTALILLCLALATAPSAALYALPPQDELIPGVVAHDSGIVGVVSTAIDCLAAGSLGSEQESASALCPSTSTVELNWQGDVESARLVISIPDPNTAPKAAHTILVNGQTAASSPACSVAQPCRPGETFYLSVPAQTVRQGANRIEITADGKADNRWMIANVRLEVMGQVTPVRSQSSDLTSTSNKTAATPMIVTFRNSLDGTNQKAIAQVPDSYNPSVATPLVLFAHARTGIMEDGITTLGAAANSKGWLLISPEMHGSWPIPSECFQVPNDCDYDDQVLAGTTPSGAEAKPGAYAHASLESQYDLIGAAKYIIDRYNVKTDQIYLVGGSMGGQTAGVVAAKFPHLFAAAFAYMGISNLDQWYGELLNPEWERTLQKECHINRARKTPTQNPFCYQRRSSVEFARNFIQVPISLTHGVYDELVPISHSRNLRNAINSFDPVHPVSIYEVWRRLCDEPYHCVNLNSNSILNYLDNYRLEQNPSHIRIAADESKLFYWLKVGQTGGAHWSYIDVTRDPDSPSVEVTTNDPNAVDIGLNLGTGWRMGEAIMQPGMGMPSTTYLLKGAGHFELVDYASGYLTTRVNTTGTSTFTLSALDVDVSADPSEVPGDQTHTSTITILVRDSSDQANPVPNGTPVQLQTTQGRFANGQKTFSLTTFDGRATTTLTVDATDDLAEITATVQQASGSATVNIVKPAVGLELTPATFTAYANVPFQMDYLVTNGGDVTLSSISVSDDNGTGGQVPVCQGLTLAPGESNICQRQVTLSQSTIVRSEVSAQATTGEDVTANDSVAIAVIAPKLGLSSTPNPLIVPEGESANLLYQVSNTGNTLLTSVGIQDDDGSQTTTVCSGITLQPGATSTCVRPVQLGQSSNAGSAAAGDETTLVATAKGTDPLGNEISIQTQTTVSTGGYVFIPYVVNRR